MKKRVFSLAIVWSCIHAGWALPSDNQQPLQVQSDEATLNYKTGIGSYQGNVIAIEGSRRLTGSEITLYRNNQTKQLDQVIVLGHLAHYQFLPDLSQKEVYAAGEKIVFLPQQHQLTITGDAMISQGSNIFKGPQITYNTETSVIHAPSILGVRPSMVIEPVDQLEKKPAPTQESAS